MVSCNYPAGGFLAFELSLNNIDSIDIESFHVSGVLAWDVGVDVTK